MKPLITDIQHFSIHDGPGIRTVIFFKGCNLTCPWCQNPESIRIPAEIAFYSNKCEKFADCKKVCPEKAIQLGKEYRINKDKCTACGLCVAACPTQALKSIGKVYPIDKLMGEILKDKAYYDSSGGGVTLSGGEVTLHTDFAKTLLTECKKHGIHTNIETNGCFSWEKFQTLLSVLDLIYFDIKILDEELSKLHLSQSHKRMLGNMKLLLEHNAPVEFRVPLIPEFTTTDENLQEIFRLLKELKISRVHLLPYHSMGEGKITPITGEMISLNLKPFSQEELNTFVTQFKREGIETILFR